MFQALLFIYLIIYVIIFFAVSKKNKSFFNSYTIGMVYSFLMQGCFLFIASFDGKLQSMFSFNVLLIFVFSIIIGLVAQYLGYSLGFRKRIKVKTIEVEVSDRNSKITFYISLFFAIISFFLLGIMGIGVVEWLTNNRHAYIVGRSGNGMYYILFLIFLCIAFTALLYRRLRLKKKNNLLIFLVLVLSYFSGSKAFILGLIVFALVCYDMFYKPIKVKQLALIGVAGLIAINVLLLVQSGITLIDYINGDFYYNYIREIDALANGEMNYYYGQLWVEDFVYNFIPRNIFPLKPFVYGTSRLPAFFFGEESVIAGNTPSFSSFGRMYADFGLVGVAIFPFISGLITGFIESTLRKTLKDKGPLLVCLCFYNMLYFVYIPVNVIILLCIVYIFFVAMQKTIWDKESRFLKNNSLLKK